jgi:hypothetical protein
MFAQFRAQYPMGSLLSELLKIHEGKYIVRAIIQVGGSTLATGLSAATTIEQAEDQARVRALVVLGIDGRPYATQAHLVNPETDELANREYPQLSAPAAQQEFLPFAAPTFPGALEVDWNAAVQSSRSVPPEQQHLSWLEQNFPQEPPGSGSPLPRDHRNDVRPTRTKAQARSSPSDFTSTTPPYPERQDPPMAIPVDLSEIIAQTDVELKRLGWSNVQGRRYLEQTYRKRSRQHLTDAELIEFLAYLKAQPSQTKP